MKKKITCRNCQDYEACRVDFHELARLGLTKIAAKTKDKSKLHEALLIVIAKLCKNYKA